MEAIKASSSYEELLDGKTAQILVVINVGKAKYRQLHVSGPKEDVYAYYRDEITMDELRRRINETHL